MCVYLYMGLHIFKLYDIISQKNNRICMESNTVKKKEQKSKTNRFMRNFKYLLLHCCIF